eukprot:6208985-Pleurochrysis_carterae.AAC.3
MSICYSLLFPNRTSIISAQQTADLDLDAAVRRASVRQRRVARVTVSGLKLNSESRIGICILRTRGNLV